MDCETGAGGGFGDYMWIGPLLVVVLAAAVVLRDPLARRLRTDSRTAALLILGFGVVLAATLAPSRIPLLPATPAGTCDLSRVGLAGWRSYVVFGTVMLNVLMFIPLGVVVGYVAPIRRRLGLVACAVGLPFAIEALQLAATPLGRACESADVSDNLAGLAIGLAIGVAAYWTLGRSAARGAPPGSDAGAEPGHDDGDRRDDLDDPDVDRAERART
jgi:hypothetical protein